MIKLPIKVFEKKIKKDRLLNFTKNRELLTFVKKCMKLVKFEYQELHGKTKFSPHFLVNGPFFL